MDVVRIVGTKTTHIDSPSEGGGGVFPVSVSRKGAETENLCHVAANDSVAVAVALRSEAHQVHIVIARATHDGCCVAPHDVVVQGGMYDEWVGAAEGDVVQLVMGLLLYVTS